MQSGGEALGEDERESEREAEAEDEGDEEEQPPILPAGSVAITAGERRERCMEQVAGMALFANVQPPVATFSQQTPDPSVTKATPPHVAPNEKQ